MSTLNSHNDWNTPLELIKVLTEEFHFDLDAAATVDNTICEHFISPEEDALVTPWVGRNVFCNPPYGRKVIYQWVKLCATSSASIVVCLLPARTDTAQTG